MAEIYLKSLDDGGNIKIPVGKTVIGRGTLLNCSDKKVSRNHALLEVSEDGTVTITPTHINPCFYQSQTDGHTQVLKKNVPQILVSGDIISLLPHAFKYKIDISSEKIKDTKHDGENDVNNKCNTENASQRAEQRQISESAFKNSENSTKAKKESEYDFNAEDNSNPELIKGISHATPKLSNNSKSDTNKDTLPNNSKPKDSDQESPQKSETNSSRKRTLPDWLSPTKSDSNNKRGPRRRKTTPKKQESEQEDDEENSKPKREEVKLSTGRSSRKIKASTSISLDDFIVSDEDFENEFQDSGSDWECEFKKKTKKKKMTSDSGSDWERENKTRKGRKKYRSSESGSDWEAEKRKHIKKRSRQKRKHDSDNNSDSDWEAKYTSRSSVQKRSTRQTTRNAKRTPCKYGKNCYRKNTAHIKEFCHPGDSDFNSEDEATPDKRTTKTTRKSTPNKQDAKQTEKTDKNDSEEAPTDEKPKEEIEKKEEIAAEPETA